MWRNFSNSLYGNCFTFNYGGVNTSNIIKFSNTQISLKLDLFLNQKKYMGNGLTRVMMVMILLTEQLVTW